MALPAKKKLLLSFLGVALILGIWSLGIVGNGMDSEANTNQMTSTLEKSKAVILEKEKLLDQNPEDSDLRLELGNQYYDLAAELQISSPEEAVIDFNKAAAHYKEYLKTNNALSVWVDLATAAYYGEDNATAEEAFQKAIKLAPKDYQAHYNYGVFLFHSKKDNPGAVKEWKTALALNPSSQDADKLQRLISGLEAEIASGQKN